MKKTSLLLFMAMVIGLKAQDNHPVKNYISLELDPAPFILGGYSFSVKFSPKKWNYCSLMASAYSSNFPDKMMSKENYDKGFRDLKLETSYALFADYFIRPDRQGWHFGASTFFYSKSVGMDDSAERTAFKSIYPNLRIGYMYKPFKSSGFYINPWLNFGKELVTSGSTALNGVNYGMSNCSYVLALHLGYQLSF
ncbi:MAG: hypothetical protein MUF75_09390 [Bacteroidia bacterium]|jgi:hypothetical protein|nr:hypothetical protein [Bacteroidia bacterium]